MRAAIAKEEAVNAERHAKRINKQDNTLNPEIIGSLARLPPPTVPGRFTIAIPTYNRAGFLRRSLQAALSQTYEKVEVLVCDNASTDDTPSVVSEFGARVRYHRHDRNLGASPNFLSAPLLATGEFFSWLQDDDQIHRDFAARAVKALTAAPDVRAYACYAASGPSVTTYISPVIYGPGVPLDWQSGQTTFFRPSDIAALGFFYNLGIPPTFACRTASMLEAIPLIPTDCDLYVERLIPLLVSSGGLYAVEPWVGGMFFQHPSQSHKVLHGAKLGTEQWRNMARRLASLIAEGSDESWRDSLANHFGQMAVSDRVRWLWDQHTAEIDWKAVHPIAHEARELLIASSPEESLPRQESTRYGLRSFVKDLTPPIALKLLRGLRRRSERRSSRHLWWFKIGWLSFQTPCQKRLR